MKAALRLLTSRSFLTATVSFVLLPLCIQISAAQSTASIEGRITDQNGGLVSHDLTSAMARSKREFH